MKKEKWRIWDNNKEYGEILYKRAIGEFQEMESSKALARILNESYGEFKNILDVGCGAGHYLKSLRNRFGDKFFYTGVDATEQYLTYAKLAFNNDSKATFLKSDIFDLSLTDKSFELTVSNNLLLHLPEIVKPINELIRVTKNMVIIRMLCGERSFIIQNVEMKEDGVEFDDFGEPLEFYYYNIYSKKYISAILNSIDRVVDYEIIEDHDYNCDNMRQAFYEHNGRYDATKIISGYQVNGYILQPWAFIVIHLS